MENPSLRDIARETGISASTLSRALRGQTNVKAETAKLALEALKKAGYLPDPVISAGLSKARLGTAYRETIALCSDGSPSTRWWLPSMFASFQEFGARLGYRVELSVVDPTDAAAVTALAKQWRARGIRGVIFIPFQSEVPQMAFPWEDFAWVTIGQLLSHLPFHHVGRDYEAELADALNWLKSRGCERPVFLSGVSLVPREVLLRTALRFYHELCEGVCQPFLDTESLTPSLVEQWLRDNDADSFVAGGRVPEWMEEMLAKGKEPKAVFLSPFEPAIWKDTICYEVRYDITARAAINMMHGLLTNREFGVPEFRQRVSICFSRRHSEAVQETAPDLQAAR